MSAVILDAGPLVAYLDKSDEHHKWAVREFNALIDTVLVCEAVISEACFLLAFNPSVQLAIGELLRRDVMALTIVGAAAQPRIFALMERYRQVPMSYADACVLWLAESHARSRSLRWIRTSASTGWSAPGLFL